MEFLTLLNEEETVRLIPYDEEVSAAILAMAEQYSICERRHKGSRPKKGKRQERITERRRRISEDEIVICDGDLLGACIPYSFCRKNGENETVSKGKAFLFLSGIGNEENVCKDGNWENTSEGEVWDYIEKSIVRR